jgi:hypothetical protein
MTRRAATWSGITAVLTWGLIAASAQTLNFAPVGSIPGPVEMVKVQGGHAYVAAGRTLTVVDVSNPVAPKRLGSYTFPEKIWGFRLAGASIYVAADVFGLGILDVSNPAAPTLRGSVKTPGQAKNVAVSGTTALVADHVSGIDIIDVSNAAKPVLAGSVFLEGFAKDVVTDGRLAYAADMPTGFYVLDLSKPGSTEPLSAVQSATAGSAQVEVLRTSGQGPAFAVLAAGGALQMYDVSNPATPVKMRPYRTPGGAARVSLEGSLAYVADFREGLQVVDLSTPSDPRIVGAYKTATPARDVAAAGPLVFVVVGSGEVVILRQTP